MQTKEVVYTQVIYRNRDTGFYLAYSNNTTHTGQHISITWVKDPFEATRVRSSLEFDYNTRRKPEVVNSDLIEVRTTSVIQINT